jgi:protein-L-isoaspartate(D-aspartate) O-methyltransferase
MIGLPLGGLVAAFVVLTVMACAPSAGPPGGEGPGEDGGPDSVAARRRARMVADQLVPRRIVDERVLGAMRTVPRHEFVPRDRAPLAHDDVPLPIGHGQTISQPYIVALMTELAAPRATDRALDVGTGSGYQAAVLAELAREVKSIEIVPELAAEARERLSRLGYANVEVRQGDGWAGWPEAAPFDVIILAAAPEEVPTALTDQLAPGGRLVLPVGDRERQVLLLITRGENGALQRRSILPVSFVPMTGGATPLP